MGPPVYWSRNYFATEIANGARLRCAVTARPLAAGMTPNRGAHVSSSTGRVAPLKRVPCPRLVTLSRCRSRARVSAVATYALDFVRRAEGMRPTMFAAMNSLTNALVTEDTAAWLGFLDAQDKVRPGGIGCIGYCMSGRYVTTVAARFPIADLCPTASGFTAFMRTKDRRGLEAPPGGCASQPISPRA